MMPTPVPKIAPYILPGQPQPQQNPPITGPNGIPQLANGITTPQQTVNGSNLSSFGVNLASPAPISYGIHGNMGNIANVISQANDATNQANKANDTRYQQMLGVLTNAQKSQNGLYNQAQTQLSSGFNSAVGDLGNSLANNQTVYGNETNRIGEQAQEAAGAASQNAISRGLGNTTIMNSMQDQVSRTANDAYLAASASKAQSDNGVYQNLANIHQNQGNAQSGLSSNQGNAQMNSAGMIGNAIQNRTDQAPSLSEYASLIEAAQAANTGSQKSTITTTNPIPVNSPLYNGAGGGGGGGGGIAASMGNYGGGGGGGSGGGGTTGAQYFGPGQAGTKDPNDYAQPSTFDKLPGGPIGSNPMPNPPSPTPGGDQSASAAPAKPGGQGVYDNQNRLLGIRYPDGSFEPNKNLA